MQHHQREAVSTGAEETDIAEREIAGEAVNDVHALREHNEDDEIEEQKMVAVDEGQHCERRHERHKNEKNVAHSLMHGGPAGLKARSGAATAPRSATDKEEDWPKSCNSFA